MRWLRRQRVAGRLPSLGQDYADAHRRYVERIGEDAELWLRTKPFSAPPGRELVECLRTFSHVVARLELGLRAQVLDVGCGPGWLSELLARCGYAVTGVDVSEDMVEIARERVAAIERPIGKGIEPQAEFHAMPVLELPWSGRFDAAILYDAMHHFDDEVETLRVIRRTLAPGGRIYIHEGVRPEPGSEGEEELIAEMEQYGTLESPFDPEYLVAVLRQAGFEHVTRFAAVDALLDLSDGEGELQRIGAQMTAPPMNTVIAFNPLPPNLSDSRATFDARIEAGSWRASSHGETLVVPVTITNTGPAYWPTGPGPDSHGVVRVGPYVPAEEGDRTELPRVALPRPVSHGESVEVEVRVPRAAVADRSHVTVDLVRERIAWFADYGSEPLVIPIPHDG